MTEFKIGDLVRHIDDIKKNYVDIGEIIELPTWDDHYLGDMYHIKWSKCSPLYHRKELLVLQAPPELFEGELSFEV